MDRKYIESYINDSGMMDRIINTLISSKDGELLEYALDSMEEKGAGCTYAYFAGRYELGKIRGDGHEVQLERLQELFDISYDERYMLESSVLFCKTDNRAKARRILKQMISQYGWSELAVEAQKMLTLLEEEGCSGVLKYGEKYILPQQVAINPGKADDRSSKAVVNPGRINDNSSTKREFPPEIESEFRNLVGMDSVKEKLYEFYQMNWLAKERREKLHLEVEDTKSYNFVLYGNPGTGKTTVARILGKLLHNLGLRETDTLIETDRSGLVGAYIGHTEENTSKILSKVKEEGATLFIDEAYTLYRKGNEKDFGIEAINCLLKDMEDNRGEYSVILAGYKKQMEEMLTEANPGFKSRFTYHITIPDYSNDELLQIAETIAKKQKFILSDGAKKAIIKRVDRERVDETFANARFIRDLMNEAQMKMAIRVANLPSKDMEDLMILKSEDFGVDEEGLGDNRVEMLLEELNALTGLNSIKEKVRNIVDSIRVRQEAEKQGINLGDNTGTLHMVFKGNAGTGKTTVARIIGKIYKELGILKRGDVFIECTRSDLVGKFQGHTSELVKNKVREALGGILFIDEAYSLCRDDNDSFGREAVDALVADIENNRDKLMVIVAGYSDDMDQFLQKNQGLSSRLSTEIFFEDYSADEMVEIFYTMIEAKNRVIPKDYKEKVWNLLSECSRAKDFGNARGVRNTVDIVISRMNSRLADMMRNGHKLSKEDFITLNAEDLDLL